MLKADIADLLTNEYPNQLTNKEIARRLAAPEPSVRRATLQLERGNRIVTGSDSTASYLTWQAYQGSQSGSSASV